MTKEKRFSTSTPDHLDEDTVPETARIIAEALPGSPEDVSSSTNWLCPGASIIEPESAISNGRKPYSCGSEFSTLSQAIWLYCSVSA